MEKVRKNFIDELLTERTGLLLLFYTKHNRYVRNCLYFYGFSDEVEWE